MNNKNIMIIFLLLVISFSNILNVYAQENSVQVVSKCSNDIIYNDDIIYSEYSTKPINTSFEIKFIDNSKQKKGANKYTNNATNGRQYLYSKYTFNTYRVKKYDSRIPVLNPVFLLSVGPGQILSVSKTISTSATIDFKGSYEDIQKDAVKKAFNLDLSGTYTCQVTKEEKFSFPDKYIKEGYNTYSWYLGVGYDTCEVVLNKIDYYQEATNTYLGFRIIEVLDGTKTVITDVPKKSIYGIPGKVK